MPINHGDCFRDHDTGTVYCYDRERHEWIEYPMSRKTDVTRIPKKILDSAFRRLYGGSELEEGHSEN